jgi:hypothetical protein
MESTVQCTKVSRAAAQQMNSQQINARGREYKAVVMYQTIGPSCLVNANERDQAAIQGTSVPEHARPVVSSEDPEAVYEIQPVGEIKLAVPEPLEKRSLQNHGSHNPANEDGFSIMAETVYAMFAYPWSIIRLSVPVSVPEETMEEKQGLLSEDFNTCSVGTMEEGCNGTPTTV